MCCLLDINGGKCFLGCKELFLLVTGEELAAITLPHRIHVNDMLLCYGDRVFSATVCCTAHRAEQTEGRSDLFCQAVLPVRSILIVPATHASWLVWLLLLTQGQAKGNQDRQLHHCVGHFFWQVQFCRN